MKILHISDLHFVSKEKNEYSLNRMLDSIIKQSKECNIEFIIFSGDLVNDGKEYTHFETVKIIVIDRLVKEIGIKPNNIFFCCGNHDVHRFQETRLVTDFINQFDSEKKLSLFTTDISEKTNFDNSLNNIKNFVNFQKQYYESEEDNIVGDLYSIHFRVINNNKVGIATINSGWRCSDSQTDSGNLLFPTQILEKLTLQLKDCQFKILIVHHPLEDFKYYNRILLENIIFDNFQLMVHGHIHKGVQKCVANNNEGLIVSSANAVLSAVDKYEQTGFSIINVDIDLKNVKINVYNIDNNYNTYNLPTVDLDIPLAGEKKNYIELRKKISEIYFEQLEIGNELFVNSLGENKEFFDRFSQPVLKKVSTAEIKNLKNSNFHNIDIESLIPAISNKAIYGKDKCGKTIILFYIYLHLLNKYNDYNQVPIFIDALSANNEKNFTVDKFIKKQLRLTLENSDYLNKNYSFVLLIDDIGRLNLEIKKSIENFISENKGSFVYLTDDETLIQLNEAVLDSLEFEKLFIHELTSKGIKQLAVNTLNCDDDISNEIFQKIRLLFTQLNLNFNFWTVSLFIWIYNKSDNRTFRNNFELIQLYIDNLLDRNAIVNENSLNIEYRQLKEFLGDLAGHLVNSKMSDSFHIKYDDLIKFITDYKTINRRFIITTEALVSLIIDRGILKLNSENSLYSFRLKGVFEYFTAVYMSENCDFTNKLFGEKGFYLSFSNEWELYAGLREKDEEFVEKIFTRTDEYFKDLNQQYKNLNIDETLKNKLNSIGNSNDSQLKAGLKNKLESRQEEIADELIDKKSMIQSVTSKQYLQLEKNSDQLEKSLMIMCRVFRNTGFKNQNLENKILDFILESACNLSLLIIDEKQSENLKDETILGFFKRFAPMIVQNFLFDAMAQDNLTEIFEAKIEKLKIEGGQELKLFALYFILVDLDFTNNKKYIDDLISISKQNIIKYGVIYKLLNYLIFNKTKDKKFLKDRIVAQQKKIDNSQKAIKDITEKIVFFERMSMGNILKN